MRRDHRHSRILSLVRGRGRMTVDELSDAVQASRETVRRDLARLCDSGLLRKFHGGAAVPELAGEGSFQARMADQVDGKRAVARRAAALFRPGDSLIVDTGSTTVMFVEEVAQIGDLTVITNSALIALAAARAGTGNTAILLGGVFRADGQETLGPAAIDQIDHYRPQHAVLTAGAIDGVGGAMDYDLEEAAVARAMIARAGQVTILADASKLGRSALFRIADLARIDNLVTDRPPPDDLAEALRRGGTAVHVAVLDGDTGPAPSSPEAS